jgi:catechol 2,3-dioxygenase-like lactoylglutathione lyase family enzyme
VGIAGRVELLPERLSMIPAFDRVDHIHLYAADRNKAEQWYADVMGFTRVHELESWSEGGGPLTLANSSGTVHIALFEASPQPCRSVIALSVGAEEFVAWRQHLVDKLKRPVEAEDHQLAWSLYFADPDGNPWEITSYQHAIIATLLKPIGM